MGPSDTCSNTIIAIGYLYASTCVSVVKKTEQAVALEVLKIPVQFLVDFLCCSLFACIDRVPLKTSQ